MQNEHNECPDVTQRRFWITINSRFGCMGGDKGLKAPWVAACDSEIHRIKESIVAKRAILAGKMKHTKLSKKRKFMRLVDLDSRKFRWSLMDKVYKSPITRDQVIKAIRKIASKTKRLSN